MTITTTQVTADEALRAVADGKSVQMIWMDDGKPFFSDFTAKIRDAMAIGEAFLIVEVEDDEPTDMEKAADVLNEAMAKVAISSEEFYDMMKSRGNAEKIADSPQNIADTCENAAEPVREPRKKLDDGKIAALFHAGWSAEKIADEIGASKQAVYAHLKALREEGRL